ncbi:MAG TPA: efflux RND transporter periplasmic adaptor subunit [Polyangiaceae bacterium]|jgi:RND family efflux transporter MFP subunit
MRYAVVLGLMLAVGCSKADPKAGGPGRKLEYPVQVAPLEKRHVQYAVTAPGSIDAFQQVQITARVAGAVDRVSFVEGQNVKEGDVLATIESDRYQVAVDQAKAAVSKAEATQKSQQAELDRREATQKTNPGLIPGEEIEQHQTSVETAKADVASANQALRVALLNLRDSYVRAPIAGVVQTRTVQTGQFLQPGAVLATILQRDPMLLRFSVSEQDAPRLKAGMQATITLRESPRQYTATITLVGGAADSQTRLVPVTAQIDQTDHQYWLRPGAFCEVNVPIGTARDSIVVPTMAVQPTEKGNVVYVVDAKNIAHAKVVELGMHTPDGNVEVTRGVEEGEPIVVRGIEPLTEGAPVKITDHTTLDALHDGGAVPTGATPSPSGSGAPHHGGSH